VEEAFVPVIKMNFDGIEIDMLFAKCDKKFATHILELAKTQGLFDDKVVQ